MWTSICTSLLPRCRNSSSDDWQLQGRGRKMLLGFVLVSALFGMLWFSGSLVWLRRHFHSLRVAGNCPYLVSGRKPAQLLILLPQRLGNRFPRKRFPAFLFCFRPSLRLFGAKSASREHEAPSHRPGNAPSSLVCFSGTVSRPPFSPVGGRFWVFRLFWPPSLFLLFG